VGTATSTPSPSTSGSVDPGRRTGTKAGRPTPGPYALQACGPRPRPGRLVRPRPRPGDPATRLSSAHRARGLPHRPGGGEDAGDRRFLDARTTRWKRCRPRSSVEPGLNIVHVGVGSASNSSPLASAGTWPTPWVTSTPRCPGMAPHWSPTPCASLTSTAARRQVEDRPPPRRLPEERSAPSRRRIDGVSVVGDNWDVVGRAIRRTTASVSNGQPVSLPTSCGAVRSAEEMRSGMAPLHDAVTCVCAT
jgi:hypothetical protein